MAEALLHRIDPTHFEVSSAGLDSAEVHPVTLDVLRDINVDLKGFQPKLVSEVHGDFDFVISIGSQAPQSLPVFPNAEYAHWRFDEATVDPPINLKHMFEVIRDQIAQRIYLFAIVQVRNEPAGLSLVS
jgi:protein-tyrosine-phosphatase